MSYEFSYNSTIRNIDDSDNQKGNAELPVRKMFVKIVNYACKSTSSASDKVPKMSNDTLQLSSSLVNKDGAPMSVEDENAKEDVQNDDDGVVDLCKVDGHNYGEAFWIGNGQEELHFANSSDISAKRKPSVKSTAFTVTADQNYSPSKGPTVTVVKYNSSTSTVEEKVSQRRSRRHSIPKMLRCTTCRKNYRNLYSLDHHICDPDSFVRGISLLQKDEIHRVVINGLKYYCCPRCRRPFKWIGNLRRHYNVHTGRRFYKCEICDKPFFTSYQVKRHMNSHLGVRYKCSICSKPFTCKYACTWHIRQHYKSLKPTPQIYNVSESGRLESSEKKEIEDDDEDNDLEVPLLNDQRRRLFTVVMSNKAKSDTASTDQPVLQATKVTLSKNTFSTNVVVKRPFLDQEVDDSLSGSNIKYVKFNNNSEQNNDDPPPLVILPTALHNS